MARISPIVGSYTHGQRVSLELYPNQIKLLVNRDEFNGTLVLRRNDNTLRKPIGFVFGQSQYPIEMGPLPKNVGIFEAQRHGLIISPEGRRILRDTGRTVGRGIYGGRNVQVDLMMSGFENIPQMIRKSYNRTRTRA